MFDDPLPLPVISAIGLLCGIVISTFVFLALTGQLKSRDWEQVCRNRADKYGLVYVDNIGSTRCWVLQPSGDLINLWQE